MTCWIDNAVQGALEGQHSKIVNDIWRYQQRVSKAWLVRHCMPTQADCAVVTGRIKTGNLLADCKALPYPPLASSWIRVSLQQRRDWCHSQLDDGVQAGKLVHVRRPLAQSA